MGVTDGYINSFEKIIDNGDPKDRWNLVIMGDGYRLIDGSSFRKEVQEFVDELKVTKPFDELWHTINIYKITVISTDFGPDDPLTCGDGSIGTGSTSATYFDSTTCSDGSTRRLLSGDDGIAMNIARAFVPEYHAIIVIVNSNLEGAAAGMVGWCSNRRAIWYKIAIHELGHSAFSLGDEYSETSFTRYFDPNEPTSPNLTVNSDRTTTKWAKLIDPSTPLSVTPFSNPDLTCLTENSLPNPVPDGTIGLYEGGSRFNCGIYHPEYKCKMNNHVDDFCFVCQERIRFILNQYGGNMSWESLGNGGTDPAKNFLGTKDNQPLIIKTNNSERLRITADGKIGINTNHSDASLSIVANGAAQLNGSVRSSTLLTSSGILGNTEGNEISLATIGYQTGGNNSFLGIRALRVSRGSSWESSAIGLGMDVDNTVRAGANLWLSGNGNVGINTSQPNAGLSIVAKGAAQLNGSVRSSTLLTSSGVLGNTEGNELSLATIGYQSGGNNSFLGIRALRVSNGATWESSAIGLGMDVDNTVRAGANLWLSGNGNVGINVNQPNASLSIVAKGASQLNGSVRSATLLTSSGILGNTIGNELSLATIGYQSGGNNSFLGIRALRVNNGATWESSAIGLGMDVDNTLRAGAHLWLHGNGNIGIGKNTTPEQKVDITSDQNETFALAAKNIGTGGGVAGLANGSLLPAVAGIANGTSVGVHGHATKATVSSIGVIGTAGQLDPFLIDAAFPGGFGVIGHSILGSGMGGVTEALNGHGVEGMYNGKGSGAGVFGFSNKTNAIGIKGQNLFGGLAGSFIGNVDVLGTINITAKNFKIDHPLDPENKFLFHSCIESPDMMNIYNGIITTDVNGDAKVNLPDYFDVLNRDFKYQLTVIGDFSQAIIANEIKENKFTIKTDRPNVKVSWQVTGIRKDPYAERHPMKVEVEKSAEEKGKFLHPELYKSHLNEVELNGIRIGYLESALSSNKVEYSAVK